MDRFARVMHAQAHGRARARTCPRTSARTSARTRPTQQRLETTSWTKLLDFYIGYMPSTVTERNAPTAEHMHKRFTVQASWWHACHGTKIGWPPWTAPAPTWPT